MRHFPLIDQPLHSAIMHLPVVRVGDTFVDSEDEDEVLTVRR